MGDEEEILDINFKDLISFYEDTICGITFVISRYPKSYMYYYSTMFYYSTIIIDKEYSDIINFFDTNLCNRHFLDNEKLPKIIQVVPGVDDNSMMLTFKHLSFKKIKLESINVINEILREKGIHKTENESRLQIVRQRNVGPDFSSPEMEIRKNKK